LLVEDAERVVDLEVDHDARGVALAAVQVAAARAESAKREKKDAIAMMKN
jgi:hypothetical protein